MLFLLSPAKTLDFDPPAGDVPHTLPQFTKQSAELIQILRAYSPEQLSGLMDLSDQLAGLNVARFQAWSSKFTPKNSKQAVLAFDGDVYEGLDAKSLKPADLSWAQEHVCILSGLYGVLRPLGLDATLPAGDGHPAAKPQRKQPLQILGHQTGRLPVTNN